MAGFPKIKQKATKPMKGVKIDSKAIIEALTKTRGNISRAADRLQCDRHTLHNRINSDPDVKQCLDNCRERFLDDSEDVLQSKVLSGDTTSLIFTLKNLGRKRGYDHDRDVITESATRGVLEFISNRSKNPAES